jgi:hypothetical protein
MLHPLTGRWMERHPDAWSWLPKPIPGVALEVRQKGLCFGFHQCAGEKDHREVHPVTGQPFPWREQDMKLKTKG